jgi:hypothetical protein
MLIAAGAVVLVVVVLIISWLVMRWNRSKSEAAETRAVFCLSAQRHGPLVEAAAALGTGAAVPGHPDQIRVGGTAVPLLTWRTDQHTSRDFDRTCTVLMRTLRADAAGAAPSPVLTFVVGALTALLPVVLGSWLTWRTTSARDRITLRRRQAEQLHQAVLEYQQVVGSYLRQREGDGEAGGDLLDTVEQRRLRVAAMLGQVAATYGHWEQPKKLRRELSDRLGGDFVRRAGRISAQTAADHRATVDDLTSRIDDVATALDAGTEPPAVPQKQQVTAGGSL